eukprot:1855635-Pyramimonas_sp.AAC.1
MPSARRAQSTGELYGRIGGSLFMSILCDNLREFDEAALVMLESDAVAWRLPVLLQCDVCNAVSGVPRFKIALGFEH